MRKKIAALHKEQGMTQLELAEIFHVSVDELMQVKADTKRSGETTGAEIVNIALKGIALAMGGTVVVLSLIKEIEANEAIRILGFRLACLTISQFPQKMKSNAAKKANQFL